MKGRKILAWLLAMAMVLTMLPASVFAEDSTTFKTIQLGTSGITDPTVVVYNSSDVYYTPNSYIYFGVNSTANDSTPIKWRVLDADKANDSTTSGMFLMSEYTLNSEVKFSTNKNNIYQGSNAQTWCKDFASNESNFSTAEQNVMIGVEKTETGGNVFGNDYCYPTDTTKSSELKTDDKMFLMSAFELRDYVGNYNNAPGLAATDTGSNGKVYYLRTSYFEAATNVGSVSKNGSVTTTGVSSKGAVRPAMNLDTSKIQFISAAENGKLTSSTMDGSLTAVENYTGNEWKLTLLDSSRNFKATVKNGGTEATGAAGSDIVLTYTNGQTGTNEYISAMLLNSDGEVVYYGRISDCGQMGQVSVKIPEGLTAGSYTLKVFSEQCNGDYKTDYASAFSDVKLTVTGSSSGDGGDEEHTHCVCGKTDCTDAAHDNAIVWTKWDSDTTLPTEAGNYYLAGNVFLSSTWEVSTAINLCLNGQTITGGANNADVIKVTTAGNLTITDCHTGDKVGKITHAASTTGRGIYNDEGTLTLWNGSIANNTEEGVWNYYDAKFIMNGGSIADNTVEGVNNEFGIFTMNDGTISGNINGGVYNHFGTFTMNGGKIIKNKIKEGDDLKAGGVTNHYGTFTMNDGTINGNNETMEFAIGGVSSNGTFTMTGGTISDNRGAIGGGVYNVGQNKSIPARFTMTGGTISGNSVGYWGGGVYNCSVDGSATFTMTGGTISGNSVNRENYYGGGVLNFGTFNVSGTPVIKDNIKKGTTDDDSVSTKDTANNVYLSDGNTITVMNEGMKSGAKVYVNGTNDGTTLITGTTNPIGFYCDTEGLSFVSDGKGGLKLAEKPDEAQIGAETYRTLEAALDAASGNSTADTIKIIGTTVTAVTNKTLKAGDSIETYSETGTMGNKIKATTDATLNVDADEILTVMGGNVNIVNGGTYLGSGATATGKSEVEITNSAESVLITVTAGDDKDTVTVPTKGGKVVINNVEYVTDKENTELEVDKDGNVTLTKGAAALDNNKEITVGGKKIKNIGDVIVTVNADEPEGKNSVVVTAGGKAKIGDVEYEAGTTGATFVIDGDGNVTLESGEAKFADNKSIIGGGSGMEIENPNGDGNGTLTVAAGEDKDAVTVSENGGVTVGKAAISNVKQETVFTVESDKVTVALKDGQAVTVKVMAYTGGTNGGSLSISTSTGEVNYSGDINITIDQSALTESFSYELAAGEAITIGKYTYIAPAGVSKGDITIKGRGVDYNPTVVLKNADTAVEIALPADSNTKTTYTAVNANTQFAMNERDTNTKSIDLLSNGNTSADSKIKVSKGVTVDSKNSSNAITSAEDNTEIGLNSNGGSVLESGAATTTGIIKAMFGNTVKNFVVAGSGNTIPYTVNATDKTLTVPENVAVKDYATYSKCAQFTNGTFTFVTDDETKDYIPVKVSAGASVIGFTDEEGGNSPTITGVDGGNTVVGIGIGDKLGYIWLDSGKGQSDGEMTAKIGDDSWNFKSNNSKKYTVGTNGILTLDEAGTVTMDDMASFAGKAGDSFTIDIDKNTATVPDGATVTDNSGNTIKGVAKTGDGKDTKVEIAKNGSLTLIEGKGVLTGEETVNVRFTDGNDSKTVEVKIPQNKSYTVDADKMPPEVSNLQKGDSVTADGITYTVTGDDSDGTFPIDSEKAQLKNNGDKAVVASGKRAIITLGSGEDAPVVTVSEKNTGNTTVTKGEPSVISLAKAEDYFIIGNKTYIADIDGTEFTVDKDGKVTRMLTSGSVTISDGDAVAIASGNLIENPKDSGNDTITVTAGDGKDTVTVPIKGGKVVINNVEYVTDKENTELEVDKDGNVTLTKGAAALDNNKEITVVGEKIKNIGNVTVTVNADEPEGKNSVVVTAGGKAKIGDVEYEAGSEAATFVIDGDGNVTLESGEAVFADGKSITGVTGKAITNPKDTGSDTITVKADSGKDTVTVAKGKSNTVTIGDVTYTNGSDENAMVIEVTEIGNKLTDGTVTLDKDEVINVCDKNVVVTNTGDKQIEVTSDGKVTVPAGGQINLGGAKITDVKQDTIFAIDKDGNAIIELAEGESITINGVVYTGGAGGGTITVDPVEKQAVIGVEGIINIKVEEDKLTADFSYVLIPGQAVTIGKYVYTAPENAEWGDVTIKGRGADENGKFFTPAVVIKNAGGTVDVTLSENEEATTKYTAENANTIFAMAADDADTTKVELLNNGAEAKSTLKFIDTKSYVVNGVTYQAQTVKDAVTGEEKAVAYTVAYGEVTNEDESVSNKNTVSVENGSKIIVTMNTGNSIQVNDKFVKATNNGASIIIDSTENANAITGNSSNLTEIKDNDGNVTGYEVAKRSTSSGGGGGGSSTCTIKFDTNGGSDLKNISVKRGQAIGTITAPTKNGYVFTGWYSDKELTKKYDNETKVTVSTTLYAGWKVDPVRQLILTIGNKDATVFGQTKSNDVAPKIVNDRTMLPARFVAENLGAAVEWDGEKQLVTITGKNAKNEDVTILITIGSDTATVNGESVKLDSPAFVENDRTYTPVRFISEELGASVEWDEATQQVIITKALASEEK